MFKATQGPLLAAALSWSGELPARTFVAATQPTELDGNIVTEVTCAETGEPVSIPPYLPEPALRGYLQGLFGTEVAIANPAFLD